jgi:hypothetical protein
LWAAAVEVAGTWRISQTAKALRVNYNALRKSITRLLPLHVDLRRIASPRFSNRPLSRE